jgi:hypothetical protein
MVDAWSTSLTDTTANLETISGNPDVTRISGVLSALVKSPVGVIDADNDSILHGRSPSVRPPGMCLIAQSPNFT